MLPAAFPEDAGDATRGPALGRRLVEALQRPARSTSWSTAALARNVDLALAAAQIQRSRSRRARNRRGRAARDRRRRQLEPHRQQHARRRCRARPASRRVRTGHRAVFQTSFELDFWGKLRDATSAAQARLLAQRYSRDMVRLLLASTDRAELLHAALARRADRDDAHDDRHARRQTLKIVGDRVNAGYASDLDLAQARLARANAGSQLRELERLRAGVEHQLQTLTGRLDAKIAVDYVAPGTVTGTTRP